MLTWHQTAEDRVALVRAVVEGSGKFFFGQSTGYMTCIAKQLMSSKGSDSAPHPVQSKKGAGGTAAGCFTQPWCTALVIGALEEAIDHGWIREEDVTRESIEGFLSGHGRAFYRMKQSVDSDGSGIRLERKGETIPEVVRSKDGTIEVVPFGRGKEILSVSWKH